MYTFPFSSAGEREKRMLNQKQAPDTSHDNVDATTNKVSKTKTQEQLEADAKEAKTQEQWASETHEAISRAAQDSEAAAKNKQGTDMLLKALEPVIVEDETQKQKKEEEQALQEFVDFNADVFHNATPSTQEIGALLDRHDKIIPVYLKGLIDLEQRGIQRMPGMNPELPIAKKISETEFILTYDNGTVVHATKVEEKWQVKIEAAGSPDLVPSSEKAPEQTNENEKMAGLLLQCKIQNPEDTPVLRQKIYEKVSTMLQTEFKKTDWNIFDETDTIQFRALGKDKENVDQGYQVTIHSKEAQGWSARVLFNADGTPKNIISYRFREDRSYESYYHKFNLESADSPAGDMASLLQQLATPDTELAADERETIYANASAILKEETGETQKWDFSENTHDIRAINFGTYSNGEGQGYALMVDCKDSTREVGNELAMLYFDADGAFRSLQSFTIKKKGMLLVEWPGERETERKNGNWYINKETNESRNGNPLMFGGDQNNKEWRLQEWEKSASETDIPLIEASARLVEVQRMIQELSHETEEQNTEGALFIGTKRPAEFLRRAKVLENAFNGVIKSKIENVEKAADEKKETIMFGNQTIAVSTKLKQLLETAKSLGVGIVPGKTLSTEIDVWEEVNYVRSNESDKTKEWENGEKLHIIYSYHYSDPISGPRFETEYLGSIDGKSFDTDVLELYVQSAIEKVKKLQKETPYKYLRVPYMPIAEENALSTKMTEEWEVAEEKIQEEVRKRRVMLEESDKPIDTGVQSKDAPKNLGVPTITPIPRKLTSAEQKKFEKMAPKKNKDKPEGFMEMLAKFFQALFGTKLAMGGAALKAVQKTADTVTGTLTKKPVDCVDGLPEDDTIYIENLEEFETRAYNRKNYKEINGGDPNSSTAQLRAVQYLRDKMGAQQYGRDSSVVSEDTTGNILNARNMPRRLNEKEKQKQPPKFVYRLATRRDPRTGEQVVVLNRYSPIPSAGRKRQEKELKDYDKMFVLTDDNKNKFTNTKAERDASTEQYVATEREREAAAKAPNMTGKAYLKYLQENPGAAQNQSSDYLFQRMFADEPEMAKIITGKDTNGRMLTGTEMDEALEQNMKRFPDQPVSKYYDATGQTAHAKAIKEMEEEMRRPASPAAVEAAGKRFDHVDRVEIRKVPPLPPLDPITDNALAEEEKKKAEAKLKGNTDPQELTYGVSSYIVPPKDEKKKSDKPK